jgi:hypothetical protein
LSEKLKICPKKIKNLSEKLKICPKNKKFVRNVFGRNGGASNRHQVSLLAQDLLQLHHLAAGRQHHVQHRLHVAPQDGAEAGNVERRRGRGAARAAWGRFYELVSVRNLRKKTLKRYFKEL